MPAHVPILQGTLQHGRYRCLGPESQFLRLFRRFGRYPAPFAFVPIWDLHVVTVELHYAAECRVAGFLRPGNLNSADDREYTQPSAIHTVLRFAPSELNLVSELIAAVESCSLQAPSFLLWKDAYFFRFLLALGASTAPAGSGSISFVATSAPCVSPCGWG